MPSHLLRVSAQLVLQYVGVLLAVDVRERDRLNAKVNVGARLLCLTQCLTNAQAAVSLSQNGAIYTQA